MARLPHRSAVAMGGPVCDPVRSRPPNGTQTMTTPVTYFVSGLGDLSSRMRAPRSNGRLGERLGNQGLESLAEDSFFGGEN